MSQTTLNQGIDDHDTTIGCSGSAEFTQHARIVCAWVLSENKSGFGLFKSSSNTEPLQLPICSVN